MKELESPREFLRRKVARRIWRVADWLERVGNRAAGYVRPGRSW
jgi:hypothetical protein